MIESAEEFVTLRQSEDPDLYTRAAQDSAREEVWLEVVKRYPEMKVWVVHNKTVPGSILRTLASDPDPNVRASVAQKRKVGDAILEKLAYDADGRVRLEVAVNKRTPLYLLRVLLHDDWERVAEVARDRLKASQ